LSDNQQSGLDSQESSDELQKVAISTFLTDPYIFSRVASIVNRSFFSKYSYKLVYIVLSKYYAKYDKIPTQDELIVLLRDEFNYELEVPIEKIISEVNELYHHTEYDEDFVVNQIQKFLKRSTTEKILYESLKSTKGKIELEKLADNIKNKLDEIEIPKRREYCIGDVTRIGEIRKSAVGDIKQLRRIPSFLPGVNESLTFHGYKNGDLIMICSPPGVGKTMFMINEGLNAALNQFKVLHIFLGDMQDYDAFIRYVSCASHTSQTKLVDMEVESQAKAVKSVNMASGILDNIYVATYGAGEITISEMITEVHRIQKEHNIHFDLINVDYADNLVPTSDNSYSSGGDIYNKLSLLGRKNNSTIIVGSQPKQCYWDDEIIPKNAAAESSKKQHVIDVMLTMGLTEHGSEYGSINLAKVRRGVSGVIIRIKTNYDQARLSQITEAEYLSGKRTLD
jgi:replicative DNA helicase